LFTAQVDIHIKNGEMNPAKAVPTAARHCEKIAANLTNESMQKEIIDWCQDGVFRHYIERSTLHLNDNAYKDAFLSFCDPMSLGIEANNDRLLSQCYEAQAFSAAERSRGDRAIADAFCAMLFELPMPGKMVGKAKCEKGVGQYLNPERLLKEKSATCSREGLFSRIAYNLPANYSSAAREGATLHTLDWFNDSTSTWTDVLSSSATDGLWWMSIDSNEAREPIEVVVRSNPLSVAESPHIDIASPSDAINAFAYVVIVAATIKLLLMVWLNRKLTGYHPR